MEGMFDGLHTALIICAVVIAVVCLGVGYGACRVGDYLAQHAHWSWK